MKTYLKDLGIEIKNFPATIELWIDKDMFGVLQPSYPIQVVMYGRMKIRHRDTGIDDYINVSRQVHVGSNYDEESIARTAYGICKELLLHELDECFYVNGVRIFDPHKDKVNA